MAPVRATRKELKESYPRLVSVGYDKPQNLLRYHRPMYYLDSYQGWDADVYVLSSIKSGVEVALVTGYRPIGKELDYKFVKDLETRAETIRNSDKYLDEIGYHARKEMLEPLVDELVDHVLQGEGN